MKAAVAAICFRFLVLLLLLFKSGIPAPNSYDSESDVWSAWTDQPITVQGPPLLRPSCKHCLWALSLMDIQSTMRRVEFRLVYVRAADTVGKSYPVSKWTILKKRIKLILEEGFSSTESRMQPHSQTVGQTARSQVPLKTKASAIDCSPPGCRIDCERGRDPREVGAALWKLSSAVRLDRLTAAAVAGEASAGAVMKKKKNCFLFY